MAKAGEFIFRKTAEKTGVRYWIGTSMFTILPWTPRDSNVLYAAGFESSVWRSADRGEHWNRVPGFNFKWGHRVIPDPADRTKIYVTTFGGSVWHGSINGTPGVVDIATPELEPGR